MTHIILMSVGGVLMLLGGVMLSAWITGKSSWFNPGVYDREGGSKTDRLYLDLYFIALVIAPLLIGAILVVFGVSMLR